MRFDSYHPMINLIYFVAAFVCIVQFHHPVFVVISYLAVFIWSVKLNRVRALIFNLILIPLAVIYMFIYSYYNHFGVTNLRTNFVGNQITLESAAYGLVLGFTAATVLMMCSCVFAIVTADKLIYLLGRISPRLSLFLSIVLRFVPRIKKRGRDIELARYGIGKSFRQGNPLRRLLHLLSIFSILITWSLEELVESSTSMKSRGYSLRGRTAFSIYRFDNRDRNVVVMMFLCMTIIAVGVAFNQTEIWYDPQIVMNRITPLSYLFYIAYAVFLFLPFLLQVIGEWRFHKNRKSIS